MGLFDRLFPKRKQKENLSYMYFMTGNQPLFTKWDAASYEHALVKMCVHTIANNAAKLKGKHIKKAKGILREVNDNLNVLLQFQPNPLMNAFDFLYKVISDLFDPDSSNTLIYIDKDDDGTVRGFYPLNFSLAEFLEDGIGNIYVRYQFQNGRKVVVPYENVIHLRRFYKNDEIFGSPATRTIKPILQLAKTTDEGIQNAIKLSTSLRGILKYNGILKPEDIKRDRDRFVQEYLNSDNQGGIGALDTKAEFIKTDLNPIMVDSNQITVIEKKVYNFFNLNENIITSKYSEEDWDAFYESVIEPLAIQLSLEFTNKIFTPRERGFGNQVIFEANRLQYASAKTKVQIVKETAPFAIFTRNEIREIFNLAPVDGGDEFILAVGGKAELISTEGKEEENEKNGKGTPDDGNTSGRNGE